MEFYLLHKIDIDNLLQRQHPEAHRIIQENRILEPVREQPNHRFQLMPGDRRDLMALPACSLFVGSADEPWYIDTGLTTDEGAVYIGRSDFIPMCSLAGFTEIEHLRRAQNKIAELEQEIVRLSDRHDRMRDAMRLLRDVQSDDDAAPSAPTRTRKQPAST